MAKDYVEERDGSFYIVDSRVPLARIVWEFQRGASPESIRSSYSTLSLQEVYGAITFYLENKEAAEKDLAEREREEREFISPFPVSPELLAKLDRARQEMLARRR